MLGRAGLKPGILAARSFENTLEIASKFDSVAVAATGCLVVQRFDAN